MPRFGYLTLTLLLPLLFLLSGCGGSKTGGRLPISGTVTFKGQSLAQGSIEFMPEQGGVSQAGAMIADGKFSIPADKGLVPGNYTVRISSLEQVAPREPGGTEGPQPKELIPAKYNIKTTLKKEVKQGATTFDFILD